MAPAEVARLSPPLPSNGNGRIGFYGPTASFTVNRPANTTLARPLTGRLSIRRSACRPLHFRLGISLRPARWVAHCSSQKSDTNSSASFCQSSTEKFHECNTCTNRSRQVQLWLQTNMVANGLRYWCSGRRQTGDRQTQTAGRRWWLTVAPLAEPPPFNVTNIFSPTDDS